MCLYRLSVYSGDNTSSTNWYSPSRRPLRRPPDSPFTGHYEDYDYACSYGDRLPAPSPVYSRHGYVQRSTLGNQCDWYARGDGDGHYDPDRFQDNNIQVPDGRSPYRQYEDFVSRSLDPLSSYFDEDGRFLDGGTLGYGGTRLPDGQARRNGGIGFDWASAAAPDRKSAYHNETMLIIGDSVNNERQRHVRKTSPLPYADDLRAADGMERRRPVGTESVPDLSPYRKEKDRGRRESPHTGGTTAAATKNDTHGRTRVKTDDIQRLTERDRVPAAQNRKQQTHVSRGERVPSPRVDESAKPSRSRGHKSSASTTAITTSGL